MNKRKRTYSGEENLEANNILCKICKNVFTEPILLPCSENICSSHLDELAESGTDSDQKRYLNCVLCNQKHQIERDSSFVLNKSLIYLCYNKSKKNKYTSIYENCVTLLEELKDSVNSLDLIKTKTELSLIEYFAELKTNVDLRRDEFINEIRNVSNEIHKQIAFKEKQFINDLNEIYKNKLDLTEFKNELNTYETELNKYKIDLNEWHDITEKLKKRNINSLKENLENLVTSSKKFKFKPGYVDSYAKLFGKTSDENIKRKIISGSVDNTIKIWDLETGICTKTLMGHTSAINSLELTNDNRIISGSNDETIRIWDVDTGECVKTLLGHEGGVRTLKLTNDKKKIISGSWDETIKIWDLQTGACLSTLLGHTYPVEAVEVTRDNKIISGSYDCSIKIWDMKTSQCIKTLFGHTDWILALQITSDNKIISGSADKTIRIWSIDTGEQLNELQGHIGSIYCLKVNSNGQVVSGSKDGEIRVWNIENGSHIKSLRGHGSSVLTLEMTQDGKIISGSSDNTIKIWNLESGECIRTLTEHTYDVPIVKIQ